MPGLEFSLILGGVSVERHLESHFSYKAKCEIAAVKQDIFNLRVCYRTKLNGKTII